MMDYELFLEVVKEKFMNYMSEWYQNGEMEIRAGNKDYNKQLQESRKQQQGK